MNDTIKIRMATEEDARPLLEIYTPYITDTVITFEYEVPTVEEFAGRIRTIRKQFPYLVAVENGRGRGEDAGAGRTERQRAGHLRAL